MAGALPPPPGGAEDAEVARRLHRELNARPTRPGGHRVHEEAAAGGRGGGQGLMAVKEEEVVEEVKIRLLEMVKEEEGEEEEVKIRLLEMVKEEEGEEDVKVRAVEWVGEGGQRRRVKPEREVVAAEARPSGRGAGRPQAGNAPPQGTSPPPSGSRKPREHPPALEPRAAAGRQRGAGGGPGRGGPALR